MPFYVYMAETHNGERDSLFYDTQYQITMKRFFSLLFTLLCVCSFLFATEWSWDTKGFDYQRIRVGEEGIWREIPSYVVSCLSYDTSSDTKLYVQWADSEDNWLADLTVSVGAKEDIPVISASEYVEIRKQEDKVEKKEARKFGEFKRSIKLSAGYGSRLIGFLSNNSNLSTPISGFPRISLPDAITLDISGNIPFIVKRWGLNLLKLIDFILLVKFVLAVEKLKRNYY